MLHGGGGWERAVMQHMLTTSSGFVVTPAVVIQGLLGPVEHGSKKRNDHVCYARKRGI